MYYAIIAAFISGFSIFLNKFAVKAWADSSVFTTAKNIAAVVLLSCLILGIKKLPELKGMAKTNWLKLALIGLIGGSIPFLLFFKGLTLASATTAAFIHKTIFIWIALLAVPILKEKLSSLQIGAFGLLATGVFFLSTPVKMSFGYGETLILAATIMWAVENIISKWTIRDISPVIVAWGRMFFGAIFLLIYLASREQLGGLTDFSAGKMWWLAVSGFILFAYVFAWYSSLKYLPVTTASAILAIAAPATAVLDAVFVKHSMKPSVILASLTIAVAAIIIGRASRKIASSISATEKAVGDASA